MEVNDEGQHHWVVDDGIHFAPLRFTVVREDGSKEHSPINLASFDQMSRAAADPKSG